MYFPRRIEIKTPNAMWTISNWSNVIVSVKHIYQVAIIIFLCFAEEVWYEDLCQSNRTRKYLCHLFGHRKCIDYDKLCDLNVDCAGGEDEDDQLHNCSKYTR